MNETVVQQMRAALQATLQPVHLAIQDDRARHAGHAGAAAGGHYRVQLVAAAFRGHGALHRHRMVYAALGNLLQHGIHALNIDARTPEEAT